MSKGVLKRCFLESGLTKSLTVCNYPNKLAMTIIFFFSKCLVFDVDSRNGTKERENDFGFKDKCISIMEDIFSQSRTGYSSLALKVLRKTRKI